MGVELSAFLEPTIDDKAHSRNRDGGLGYVCGENNFTEAGGSYGECFVLNVGWEGGVEGTDEKLEIRSTCSQVSYIVFVLRYLGL